jgi:endonuclease G, mitochondrial
MVNDEQNNQFFEHYERILIGPMSTAVTERSVQAETRGGASERMEKVNDSLGILVEKYLWNDPDAMEVANLIRTQGGETLKRLGDRDESLLSDPKHGEMLEVIVRTDGSRPSFLVSNGRIDFDSSVAGLWPDKLNHQLQAIEKSLESVGRVELSDRHIGTGFLIGPNWVVTNRHVLQAIANRNSNGWRLLGKVTIDFGRELNGVDSRNKRSVKSVLFSGLKPVNPSQIDHSVLDLVVLELEATGSSAKESLSFGKINPFETQGMVLIVGYPGPPPAGVPLSLSERLFQSQFGYKRIAPGELVSPQVVVPDWTFAHDATTLGGNSGSPVLSLADVACAVGLHYGGKWAEPRENWAHNLALVGSELDALTNAPLEKIVLNSHSNGRRADKLVAVQSNLSRSTSTRDRPKPGAASNEKVDIQQMVHLGQYRGSTRLESMEIEAAGDGETSASALTDRKGYAPDFLEGWTLELPQPENDIRSLRRGGSGHELKYQHFSVIMSQSRRLPIITAANIDGSQSRRLPRVDKWNYDGRLNRDDQWGNELYVGNNIDRGHMVRREDPVWGTVAIARKANVDTFHYTNSCPQMAGVNQKVWLGLENYVLSHTREDQMRVSVFTGPYFSDEDMEYRGARIPMAFWKVVAFLLDDGSPSATAYEVSQERELADLEFVFAGYKTFQISIQQVIDRTGIDFTAMLPFDGFSTQERASGETIRETLEDFSQIRV